MILFLFACTSHAVSPSPGLRSPTFRHLYIATRVSQDFTASAVVVTILCVIGASFSLIECASCHGISNPMASLRRVEPHCRQSMNRCTEVVIECVLGRNTETCIFSALFFAVRCLRARKVAEVLQSAEWVKRRTF